MSGEHDGIAGIIPACAGNTLGRQELTEAHWDHPRMRGEHNCVYALEIHIQGSSPHARGTRLDAARR